MNTNNGSFELFECLGYGYWVGFGASWSREPLFLNSSFMFGRTHNLCLEDHMAAHSKRHFLSVVFGRTHFIMFRRLCPVSWNSRIPHRNRKILFVLGTDYSLERLECKSKKVPISSGKITVYLKLVPNRKEGLKKDNWTDRQNSVGFNIDVIPLNSAPLTERRCY